MDYKHRREAGKKASVLQGDELFFNRILSRDSSVGCSSRVFYYRKDGQGVPFNWEMQPGTPKHPQRQEPMIPPLSPPPAVLSLGLPKPCINIDEEPNKASMRKRLRFWIKGKRHQSHVKKIQFGSKGVDPNVVNGFESCSLDGEFMASPPRNSSSSSSSSFSFSNGHSSRYESPTTNSLDRVYGCTPWKFTSILVRVTRRV